MPVRRLPLRDASAAETLSAYRGAPRGWLLPHLCSFVSILLFSSCSAPTLKTSVHPYTGAPHAVPSPHPTLAGAAKIDLTPFPGYPTEGSGPEGRIARGAWTRLYAHAIYVEDSVGTNLALVSCDLWGMPGGLSDHVLELAQDRYHVPLNREHLIISATHTHLGPGNYTSWELYNSFASPTEGFDEDLFEFLADRIAGAISHAYASRTPAEIRYGALPVSLLERNRSFDAFSMDADADSILRANRDVPLGDVSALYPDSLAYRAVDPLVRVLSFRLPEGPDLGTFAIAAFAAVHPIALGGKAEVYASDLFGVAESDVENSFRNSNRKPVVAIFNGPEGDISPVWTTQDRQTALGLGHRLAAGIQSIVRRSEPVPYGRLQYRYDVLPIAATCFTDSLSLAGLQRPLKRCTDEHAYPGDPVLGGAEDGRTTFYEAGWQEGIKGDRSGYQSPKQIALDPRFLPNPLRQIANMILSSFRDKHAPSLIPLGVYQIGPLLIATLPGEFTTSLGGRIRKTLLAGRPGIRDVIEVGLANEYVYYFTTPEEYEVQDYEGAATLYGNASGPLVMAGLENLARGLDTPAPPDRKWDMTYYPGSKTSFSPVDGLEFGPSLPEAGLETFLSRSPSGSAGRRNPRVEWKTGYPKLLLPTGPPFSPLIPEVGIQPADSTAGLPGSDNLGTDFLTVISGISRDSVRWCSLWLVPDSLRNSDAAYQFVVPSERLVSDRFRVSDVLSGNVPPVIRLRKGPPGARGSK